MSSNRPRLVSALALLALSGCGFSPLYGGGAGDQAGVRLSEVFVPVIPDRSGQVLRESLETKLQAGAQPTQQLYALAVQYGIAEEAVGVQADSATTRTRFVGTAKWRLTPIGDPSHVLAAGTSTGFDAENIINQQYFAVTLEQETIDQQLAEAISGQITDQLAAWFRAHPNA